MPQYDWAVDGKSVCSDYQFVYTPSSTGLSTVTLTVTETLSEDAATVTGTKKASVGIAVLCSEPSDVKRETEHTSSAEWNRVYEYMPAPGQFINEPKSGYKDVRTCSRPASMPKVV